MGLLRHKNQVQKAMLPNGPDSQFLAHRGLAALNEMSENCEDGLFRNRALMEPHRPARLMAQPEF